MKTSVPNRVRSYTRLTIALLGLALLAAVPAIAADLNVTGNLTVTGTVDSDGSLVTFGTQAGSYGAGQQYTDSSTDTLKFLINRSPASWLWVHNSSIPAMRLDSAHQLLLYNAAGTTAGITLTPVSNQISLGTATLTGSGTTLTAGGALTVASGITNTNGSLTGGASGLALNSGTAATNITLTAAGAGDIVFNTNGVERARITSAGNVGVGISNPSYALHLQGSSSATSGIGLRNATASATGGIYVDNNAVLSLGQPGVSQYLNVKMVNGNVGIGTASPGLKLSVNGSASVGGADFPAGTNSLNIYSGNTAGNSGWLRVGQSANVGLETGWYYNATPANAYAVIGTYSYANPLRIDASAITLQSQSGGNVGIGTTTPGAKLEAYAPSAEAIRIRGDSSYLALFNTAGTRQGYLQGSSSNVVLASDAGVVAFNANGSERMRIDTVGNVGVGTSSPYAKLTAVGSISAGSAPTAITGTNVASLTASAAKSQLYLIRSVGTWSDTWWDWTHDSDNKLKLGFCTVPQAEFANGQASFFGNVSVKSSTTTFGSMALNPGGSGYAGYIDWYRNGPTRLAYMGYQDFAGSQNNLGLNLENGANFIIGGGNVGIGTTNPGTYKLAVNGTIRAKEIIVDTGWADYVFDESYNLAPLSDVEAHIKAKKHLPGIPSAAEIAEHGVSMGDMQSKLLSKIEELTLHMIAQQKQMVEQEKNLSARIDRLEQENRQLRTASANP